MEGEVITKLLGGLREIAENLPDRRKSSNGQKYEPADFLMSAFAVFYFQHPSMLDFQKAMEEREKRNNLRTLFAVENIPGTDQVRKILEPVQYLYKIHKRMCIGINNRVAEPRGMLFS
jgi:hypothetical protein